MSRYFLSLFLILLVSLSVQPAFLAAQTPGNTPLGDGTSGNTPLPDIKPQIDNPLEADSFEELAEDIINILIRLGIPVAVFFIMYAGFLFVTARGNEEQLKTAKKILLWAVVGTAVLLGALVIASAIKGTIDQIKAD